MLPFVRGHPAKVSSGFVSLACHGVCGELRSPACDPGTFQTHAHVVKQPARRAVTAPAQVTAAPERRRYDRSIVDGPLSRAVWNIAWPTMLTNIIGGLQGIIDHVMVGHFVGFRGDRRTSCLKHQFTQIPTVPREAKLTDNLDTLWRPEICRYLLAK